jgi:phosphatidate phosphatase APP1
VRVQPFFGFRNTERLLVNARAIRSREPVFVKRSFWRDFRTMAGVYLSKEVPDLVVDLEYALPDGRVLRQSAATGQEGYVRFDLPLSPGIPTAERTRWEKAVLRWRPSDSAECLETDVWILTPGSQTRVGIISDIDDTILETGVAGGFRAIARNWKRVMAQMPSDRVPVPGASSFLAALGGAPADSAEFASPVDPATPEARVRPVFYVSSSPWNLFSYLVRERGLPLGPVMLRDWGFNRKTLGSEGHGSHKEEAIQRILATFPHLKFALIGDDTQKDLTAFGRIAGEFPGRIAAVFIRAVTGAPLNNEELHALDTFERMGVPYWSGSDYAEAKRFLRGAGLDLEGGVKSLVRTASRGE